MDQTIAAKERASKHLKELNKMAAEAMSFNVGRFDNDSDLDGIISSLVGQTDDPETVQKETKPNSLVRRHTITTMPTSAANLTLDENSSRHKAAADSSLFEDSSPLTHMSVPNKTDSRAYVGSFTHTNSTNEKTGIITFIFIDLLMKLILLLFIICLSKSIPTDVLGRFDTSSLSIVLHDARK